MGFAPASVKWRYTMLYQFRIFMLRLIGLVLIVAALLADSAVLVWLALIPLFLAWATAYGRRRLFLRNLHGLPRLDATDPMPEMDSWPKVTVISPGRNEEDAIEKAARSLAALDYPNLEILVVNDHSTDRTGEILNGLKGELPQVRVVEDPPVQEGWLGKANAIWYAVQQADPQAEWLLLTDADTEFDPSAVKRGVALAEKEGLDFLTCVPYLSNGSIWEEFVIPIQWQGVICGARYDRVNHPKGLPLGVGPYILVRRRVYLASGGHSAFPAEQPEDTLLAATVKEWGGKMGIAWTPNIARVRCYRGRKQLIQFGVRKNRIWGDDSPSIFAALMLLWLIVYILPLPLSIVAVLKQVQSRDFSWGLTFYALMSFWTYYTLARSIGDARSMTYLRPGIEWMHPVGGLFRLYMEFLSFFGAAFGRPLEWRGRSFVNIRTAAK